MREARRLQAQSNLIRIFAIRNEGGNAATLVGSVRCLSNDTVSLKVVVSRTVSHGDEPAPFGETSANVTCTPRLEDRFVYVPILRDGPSPPAA
ncbi:hypothetical protein ACTMTF_41370 [Nonomuraea sp. ZG12]|uniref:hypothetical protein n=1 Tax=Nonomuraea sp. ZG12 TaxID=3452207 RepID=UPI003F88B57A